MKDIKIVIALVVGIMIGLGIRGMDFGHNTPPAFLDRHVHSYLVEQLKSVPEVKKVESLQMGFDGKSLLATVLAQDGKTKVEIPYTLENGYYRAHGQWDFIGSAVTLWPYEID